MKKYLVLGVLFVLPIVVYLFFASGKNHFARLPVLTDGVNELNAVRLEDGTPPTLKDHITVLGFFGSNVSEKEANAFNLAHKIYKKNYQFEDFQFVILVTPDQRDAVAALKQQLATIADPLNYNFAYGELPEIRAIFDSLKSGYALAKDGSSDYVFIIDKEGNLRGRTDDEDLGTLFGFNASDYAEINNKMSDDIKVILAEYRLELKKYKAEREI